MSFIWSEKVHAFAERVWREAQEEGMTIKEFGQYIGELPSFFSSKTKDLKLADVVGH